MRDLTILNAVQSGKSRHKGVTLSTAKESPILKAFCSYTIATFTVFTLLASNSLQAAEDAEYLKLFEAAFGRQQKKPKHIVVPVQIDGELGSDVHIYHDAENEETWIGAEALLKDLKTIVLPEIAVSLQQAVTHKNRISITSLKQAGLLALYNSANLTLDVSIPYNLKKSRKISLAPSELLLINQDYLHTPAKISAYINVGSSLTHDRSASGMSGRKPWVKNVQLDGAVNINSMVLENQHTYNEVALKPWKRDYTRLVMDNPKRLWRFTAGDFSFLPVGFQSIIPLAGLNLTIDFSLSPYEKFHARGEQSFILTSESEVKVFSNGYPISTLTLKAGEYQLTDLNLSEGANDIVLEITDSFGNVTEKSFTVFHSHRLLKTDVSRFSYSLGYPSFIEEGKLKYDTTHPVFSGFYQRGLTPTLTLGVNAQGHKQGRVVGASGIAATSFGNISGDLVTSWAKHRGTGYAAHLIHNYQFGTFNNGSEKHSLTWSAEYRSTDFAVLQRPTDSDLAPNINNPFRFALSSKLQLNFPNHWSVGLSGNYQNSTITAEQDQYRTDLGLRKGFDRGATLSLQYSRIHNTTGNIEDFVSMTLSAPLQKAGRNRRYHRLDSRYSSRTETYGLDYTVSPKSNIGPGSLSGKLSAIHQSNAKYYTGNIRYGSQRFSTNLLHSEAFDLNRQRSHRTNINFNSALLFADGEFALSRPVINSFALFKSEAKLPEEGIGIIPEGAMGTLIDDKVEGRHAAIINNYGPGVITELAPYRYYSYSADMSALPLGTDTSQSDVTLLPSYRSGFVVDVGGALGTIVDGQLYAPDGTPLGQGAGEVIFLDRPNTPSIQFFTTRSGRFRLMPLPPGHYRIETYTYPTMPIEFEIPKNMLGELYSIGKLRIGS